MIYRFCVEKMLMGGRSYFQLHQCIVQAPRLLLGDLKPTSAQRRR